MDPILRLTLFIARFQRNPWGRTKILVGLAVLCIALTIGVVDKLGYWPDALRSHSAKGHWVYR